MMRFYFFLLALFISYILLFTSTELIAVTQPIYEKGYTDNQVYESAYVEDYPVRKVTQDIILYLSDWSDDMNRRGFFMEREHIHMMDVKDLFTLGRILRSLSLLAVAGLLVVLKNQQQFTKKLIQAYMGVIIFFGVIVTAGVLNFQKAFVAFHHIFFNNDYWILDPQNSIIINLMPQNFFVQLSQYIALIFVTLTFGSYFLISFMYNRKHIQ